MTVPLLSYIRSRRYYGRRNKSVKITYNMGLFLHYLLTSLEFKDGELLFNPCSDTRALLNDFNRKDVIDTYFRLGLNNGLFGDSLVREATDYVRLKHRRWWVHYHDKECVKK